MAVLIVIASSKQTQRNMETALRDSPDLFLGKPARNIYLMRSNGLALWYAWKEKNRNPLYVDVYVADELHQWQIPDPIRRSVEWKVDNKYSPYPVSEGTLTTNGLVSREGVGEDRSEFLDNVATQGLRILKENVRGALPNNVDQLSPTTRRQLQDLLQQSVAEWKARREGK